MWYPHKVGDGDELECGITQDEAPLEPRPSIPEGAPVTAAAPATRRAMVLANLITGVLEIPD